MSAMPLRVALLLVMSMLVQTRPMHMVSPDSGVRVTYYGLRLRFDPVGQSVSGRVVMRVSVDRADHHTLGLQLASSMTVDSATAGPRRLAVGQDGSSLKE